MKNLEFLVIKSRELLQEQLKSYESANNKAGILISISALLIPISVGYISNANTIIFVKFLIIIPITLMIVALIYLLKVLMPKGLDHGFNFEQFDNQVNKSYKELLIYEISANKSSYRDNVDIVIKQNRNFKKGIKLIFSSAILIFTLVTVSLFMSNAENKINLRKENIIEKVDTNLNRETMCDNNSDSNSNSESNQNNDNQSIPQETINFPDVSREERANIEKAIESDSLKKK